MKYLSKINRGAIFTAAVILAVIGYLIVNSIIQSREIPAIKQISESYIQAEIKYNMLPAQYRQEDPQIPETELDSFLAKMKSDIVAFYPQQEQYYKFAVDNRSNDLMSQAGGNNVVFQYTKTIVEYESIIFDKDIVDVKILTNSTIEAEGLNPVGSLNREKVTQETQDNIILQKIDGEWKVIYAIIIRPSQNDFREKTGAPVVR